MFENMVLIEVFGPKREEVIGEEIHDLDSLNTAIRPG